MTAVILEYRRDDAEMTSSGRLLLDGGELLVFKGYAFRDMLKAVARVLSDAPTEGEVSVAIQRTDREGLTPYALEASTVKLLREDPVAAIQAMEFPTQSPSLTVQRAREERAPRVVVPIRAGHDTLADAFGDVVYFKVREHELECPGCGFWGMYASPGLLKDKERAGEVFKTAFMCPKKCHTRFIVTCMMGWGFVQAEYLLKNTTLSSFYLPRAWNEGKPWVSRESLQQKYDAYKKEKETCSVTVDDKSA